jgi:hypothetical protein
MIQPFALSRSRSHRLFSFCCFMYYHVFIPCIHTMYSFSTEAEFETKLVEMQNRHASELSAACQTEKVGEEATSGAVEKASKNGPNSVSDDNAQAQAQATQKLERLRLKKEAEREQRLAAEQALKDELNALGPSRRDLEVQAILSVLEPLGYTLQHVAADGNCLYRSIAGQVQQQSNDPSCTYTKIRTFMRLYGFGFAPCPFSRCFVRLVRYRPTDHCTLCLFSIGKTHRYRITLCRYLGGAFNRLCPVLCL